MSQTTNANSIAVMSLLEQISEQKEVNFGSKSGNIAVDLSNDWNATINNDFTSARRFPRLCMRLSLLLGCCNERKRQLKS